jgi:hypothetical protein
MTNVSSGKMAGMIRSVLGLGVLLALACNSNVTLFNPAFTNQLSGGVYPFTPGPNTDFLLVRVLNATTDTVEFVITVEREFFVLDDEGTPVFDDENDNGIRDPGEPLVTRPERQTVRMNTSANGKAGDLGVLFECGVSEVTLVGLGENLLPTDVAAFVGGQGAGGEVGFGVTAEGLNPLSLADSNFNCGDTIIFRAYQSSAKAGGVAIESLLLPNSEQPSEFSGADTFVNYQEFLESQIQENEP